MVERFGTNRISELTAKDAEAFILFLKLRLSGYEEKLDRIESLALADVPDF
jgi:hypothetical protein